ncbi:hypothetical protein AB7008_36200 [Bradyrhizobium sp. 521_C7_N1_3]|uniref:hypothetical protein n=1 Tax=Bradyrhizobium sp. 521_C7_N1_3 TaxID=3240368 RepID=UPI003F8C4E9B
MALQFRRRKSPLAMDSINGRYCRSPRERDAVARNAAGRMEFEAATSHSAENSESGSVRAGKIKQTRNNRAEQKITQ